MTEFVHSMKIRYTRHQVPRGTRADGETHDKLVLAKHVSVLRATYQIRLLAFRAVQERRKLVIMVPEHCVIHPTLRLLVKEVPKTITFERRKQAWGSILTPQNAFESFVDVEGELLVERLQSLVETALEHRLPILFQQQRPRARLLDRIAQDAVGPKKGSGSETN